MCPQDQPFAITGFGTKNCCPTVTLVLPSYNFTENVTCTECKSQSDCDDFKCKFVKFLLYIDPTTIININLSDVSYG